MTSLINYELLDRFKNQQGLLDHLVRLYLDTTPENIRQIESAAETGDKATVAFHAHSLKGASSEMGAEQLSDHCQQLQQIARAGDDRSIMDNVNQVLNCYRKTRSELEAVIEENAVAG